MLPIFTYAGALRCIGQALQRREIEIFELKSYAHEFRLQAGDPNPPHIALIEVRFSLDELEILNRQGKACRGQSDEPVRFDDTSQMLRAIGGYIDSKRGGLVRIDNSYPSMSADPAIEVEYKTRAGIVQAEKLVMSFLREACVNMYKRRSRLSGGWSF